jgi:quercetin dioxygenase-like cupin family protein
MKKMSYILTPVLFLFLFLFHVPASAQDSSKAAMSQAGGDHVIFNETDIKWGDAPPALPKGAKMAVVQGDPSKEGEFTIRVVFPANYRIAPHWHPTTENVTVLKGNIYLGTGDKFDESKATLIKSGGFASIPATHHHFAYTKDECIFQVHAMGPFVINYLNPADDPSKK